MGSKSTRSFSFFASEYAAVTSAIQYNIRNASKDSKKLKELKHLDRQLIIKKCMENCHKYGKFMKQEKKNEYYD